MSASQPTDEQLKNTIKALIPKIDVDTMGVKEFMRLLSKELGGINLKLRKKFIKESLVKAISKTHEKNRDQLAAKREEGDASSDSGESAPALERKRKSVSKAAKRNQADTSDSDESVPSPKKSKSGGSLAVKKKRKKKADTSDSDESAPAPKKRKGGGGGLTVKKEISVKLEAFLCKGKELARTEIVKYLWEYIREHDLQNPEDKREIILDEAMKDVFGCDTFTMFSMNKYISAHIHPFKPVVLITTSSTPKEKVKKPERKKRKGGTQPPYQLSDALIAVVGKPILPRPQAVAAIWVYIKANNLQNPENKREIICDEKLRAVMKKKKTTMFEMNALISPHFLEKLDKSAYQHDNEENNDSDGDDSSP
jgi:upstream activation factor subunit UAF30